LHGNIKGMLGSVGVCRAGLSLDEIRSNVVAVRGYGCLHIFVTIRYTPLHGPTNGSGSGGGDVCKILHFLAPKAHALQVPQYGYARDIRTEVAVPTGWYRGGSQCPCTAPEWSQATGTGVPTFARVRQDA
jgi:hypothetical protein